MSVPCNIICTYVCVMYITYIYVNIKNVFEYVLKKHSIYTHTYIHTYIHMIYMYLFIFICIYISMYSPTGI